MLIGHWRDYCDERQKLGLPIEPQRWRAGRTLLVTETDEEAQAYLRTPGNALSGISSTSSASRATAASSTC